MRLTAVFAAFAVAFADDTAAQEDSLEDLGIFVKEAGGGAATPVAQPQETFSPLYELSESNFSDFVSSSNAVLVEFYAPWCSICKSIKRDVARAAWLAYNLSLPVSIAVIDNVNKEVADAYGVTQIPRFFLFRNGSYEDFPLLTTGEAIVAGLDKLLDLGINISPIKDVGDDAADVASWLFWRGTSDGAIATTLVLYDPPALTGAASVAAGALRTAYDGASRELMRFSNLRFATVRAPSVFEAFEIPTDAAHVAMYYQHDEGKVIHGATADATAAELVDWILRYDVPLVEPVTHRNLLSARRRVKHFGLFFVTAEQVDHPPTFNRISDALFEALREFEVAGAFKRGEVTIGIVNGKKYASWLELWGKNASSLPALVFEDIVEGGLYGAPDALSAAATANPPAAFLAAHPPEDPEADAAEEEGAVAIDPATGEALPPPPKLPKLPPLTWVDVPRPEVSAFLRAYFGGLLAPARVLEPWERAHPEPRPEDAGLGGWAAEAVKAPHRPPRANTIEPVAE